MMSIEYDKDSKNWNVNENKNVPDNNKKYMYIAQAQLINHNNPSQF
jgi:hypothetical protein